MPVSLDTLDAQAPLASHEAELQQAEALMFEVVGLAAGHVGGQRANIVTLRSVAAKPGAIHLRIVDDALTKDQQEATLNADMPKLVCYGTLYVQGTLKNVAAFR